MPAAFKIGGKENAHHCLGQYFRDKTRRQRDDISVVVLDWAKSSQFLRPADGATDLLVFVGRDGYPIGAAAKQDTAIRLAAFHGFGYGVRKIRVITNRGSGYQNPAPCVPVPEASK